MTPEQPAKGARDLAIADGQRSVGTVLVLRCPHCGKSSETRRPMVPVDQLNEERERAERAEAAASVLREALEFLRSCELSGVQAADHPLVLYALGQS